MGWINTISCPELVRQEGTQILTTFLYHFLPDNLSEKLRCFASNNLSDNGGNGFLVEAFSKDFILFVIMVPCRKVSANEVLSYAAHHNNCFEHL